MTESTIQGDLVGALTALLNAVDYTQPGGAKVGSMLGQAVDRPTIARARAALKRAKAAG